MNLIIGLGNPGKKYENTRHNVGFMALDKMASDFKFIKKFNAEIVKLITQPFLSARPSIFFIDKEGKRGFPTKTILAKPQTFMNLSGQATQQIMSFYKIKPENLTVIHDDLDIRLGEFKIQKNRSSAGHNGVQSIIKQLGTQNFARIRIGINKSKTIQHRGVGQKSKINGEKFVLEKFSKKELDIIEEVVSKIDLFFNNRKQTNSL